MLCRALKEILFMSKPASHDTLEAMRDQDRKQAGATPTRQEELRQEHAVHAHTKPAGDLRNVELKEDSRKVLRQDARRGE